MTGSHGGHESHYRWDWFRALAFKSEWTAKMHNDRVLWGKTVASNPPVIAYEDVMRSDDGVKRWTSLIVRHIVLPENSGLTLTAPLGILLRR